MNRFARTLTALACGMAYAASAAPALLLAAWFSPLLPAGGRMSGALIFLAACAWLGTSYGVRYVDGHPGAARTPLWLALYGGVVTVFVWGYGHAWLLDPTGARLSILAPVAGLARGIHFTVLLLVSAAPLMAPAWWLVNRLLQRHALRLYAAAL